MTNYLYSIPSFNHMKKKIKNFIKNKKEMTLKFSHDKDSNVLYEWTNLQHPLKSGFNTFIINICKNLTLKFKVHVLRFLLGMKIGKNVGISPGVQFDVFYPNLIEIKDNVVIGWNVKMLCHDLTSSSIHVGRIKIGKNSLIGAFSVIRAGVKIGKNSIIAMHSFVNKDVPDNEIWGGTPAKFIKKNH